MYYRLKNCDLGELVYILQYKKILEKKIFPYLPYLAFSDMLPEPHLYFFGPKRQGNEMTNSVDLLLSRSCLVWVTTVHAHSICPKIYDHYGSRKAVLSIRCKF